MKKLIVLLLIFLPIMGWCQEMVEIPKKDLNELVDVSMRMLKRDSINDVLIENLKDQIAELKFQKKQDSLIQVNYIQRLEFKDEILAIKEQKIDLYIDRNQYLEKKVSKKGTGKVLWYGLGVATVVLSSWAYSNVSN